MIDIKLLREDPELVRASQRARGDDEGVVDAIRAADERRRSSLTAFERLRAEQKSMGKEVAKAQGEEKQALLARTKEISAEVKTLQSTADDAQTGALGRMTILMPQLSPSPSWRGAPRAARAGTSRWRIGCSTCWLRRASPDGSRRTTSQVSPRLAPAVLTPG